MNDAFTEYATARCDEILTGNKEYQDLGTEILKAEKNLTDIIGEKGIEEFLMYEELVEKRNSIGNLILYSENPFVRKAAI